MLLIVESLDVASDQGQQFIFRSFNHSNMNSHSKELKTSNTSLILRWPRRGGGGGMDVTPQHVFPIFLGNGKRFFAR